MEVQIKRRLLFGKGRPKVCVSNLECLKEHPNPKKDWKPPEEV